MWVHKNSGGQSLKKKECHNHKCPEQSHCTKENITNIITGPLTAYLLSNLL